jgi:hypothetical protein
LCHAQSLAKEFPCAKRQRLTPARLFLGVSRFGIGVFI